MNANEIARELGTDAKKLRQFFRQDSNYQNSESGAKYEFDRQHIPTMRRRFEEWVSAKASRVAAVRAPRVESTVKKSKKPATPKANNDTPLDVEILYMPLTRTERARRDELSRARVDRLEQRLMESGNHISQLKNREWSA